MKQIPLVYAFIVLGILALVVPFFDYTITGGTDTVSYVAVGAAGLIVLYMVVAGFLGWLRDRKADKE